MRLFIAVDLDDATRASSAKVLEQAKALTDAKWVDPRGLHLTLVYLGEFDFETARAAMNDVARQFAPRALQLKGAGTFTDRVLWLGVEGELADVQKALAQKLNVKNEHGEYRPHLTLARGLRTSRLAEAASALATADAGALNVKELVLFESRAGQYLRLASAALSGLSHG